MKIVLTNETPRQVPALFAVRVDGGPVIASFDADPSKELAACLRAAAKAIDAADPTTVAMALLSGAVLD